MTFKIECETNGTTYEIANSAIMEELPVLDPVLSEELNNVPQLTFALPSANPNRGYIVPFISVIRAYIDGSLVFMGRAFTPEYDWNNTAMYTCEGALGYLNDTIMRPYGYSGTASFVLGKILTAHNSQVEAKKQIQLGTVDVTGSFGIEEDEYSTCMDALAHVLEMLPGFIKIRVASGVTYLDYLQQYTTANTQTIRFGENLLDLKKYKSVEELKTAIIPLGATLDDGSVVNIASANGNVDYIYDASAVSAYGWIWGTVTWDSIDTPAALLAKAQSYLNELVALPETVEVSAVDLAAIDADIERFKLGGATTMVSVPHGISKTALLTEKTTHFADPASDTITIGATTKEQTLTGQNSNTIRTFSSRMANSANNASRFSQFVSGGLGGYVVLDYANDGDPEDRTLPYRILIMDSDNKATAVNVLQLNRYGIGFSSNGVNGSFYNSWTIDGQLSLGGTDNAYGALRILDPGGNVIGSWTKDGIVLNQGVINFLWGNSQTGVYADGTKFQAGDWIISQVNGRSVIQSSDEKTGMSATPSDSNGMYMWAGWEGSSEYVFQVGQGDAYVMYNGDEYEIGKSLANLNSVVDVSGGVNTGSDIGDEEDAAVVGGLIYEDGWVISPGV